MTQETDGVKAEEQADSVRFEFVEKAESPTVEYLILKRPLYEAMGLDRSEQCITYMRYLRCKKHRVDAFCPGCDRDSVFVSIGENQQGGAPSQFFAEPLSFVWLSDHDFCLSLGCVRDSAHKLVCYLSISNMKLTKVGQYPSLADFASGEIATYRKVLGQSGAKELHRAIGLAAHGAGIGAFAYLRRVFENLLSKHHRTYEATHGAVANFEKMWMGEKIDALKDELPPFLVANKSLYNVLSKGLHQQTEEECLAYFPMLREPIMLILAQDEAARATKERETKAAAELAKVNARFAP